MLRSSNSFSVCYAYSTTSSLEILRSSDATCWRLRKSVYRKTRRSMGMSWIGLLLVIKFFAIFKYGIIGQVYSVRPIDASPAWVKLKVVK